MNNATRDLLAHHFDTAFAAPDGIKKLRELILTLAMQGKLVPQDPNDPPASQLLKEIEAEKKRLVKEGKIKTPKPLPEIKPEEVPYALPEGWRWSTLAEAALINPRNTAPDLTEVSFVPMTLIGTGLEGAHGHEERTWGEVKQGFTHFAEGDIGVAKITPCFENSKACVFSGLKSGIGAGTTELHVIRPVSATISAPFVLAYLKSPQFLLNGQGKMTGTAGQKRLPKEFVESNPFPLPPLPEQHRIVAKIDQLIARCDALEKLRAEQAQKRRSVHTAALKRLLDAQAGDSFADAWQFVTQHFGELYALRENVTELRKAILQLAVMGKLVPQNPHDPPASQLLKEIKAEKKRLVKEGTIKEPKALPEIKPEEVPYALPARWEWVRLGDIASKITDGDHKTPPRISVGLRLFSAKNVRNGYLDFENCDFISEQHYLKSRERCCPDTGDLLIVSVGGTIGRTSLVPDDSDFALVRSVALIKPLLFSSSYLKHAMDSSLLQDSIHARKRGGAQPCLYLSEIEQFIFSLPPLPEQHRIVAKIDQLMALCDTLEKQIDAATGKQTKLLNAVMAQV